MTRLIFSTFIFEETLVANSPAQLAERVNNLPAPDYSETQGAAACGHNALADRGEASDAR